MALTTTHAAGLVSGPAAAQQAPVLVLVRVRLLRAVRHQGEHVEAGSVLEVTRAQAQELRGMHKAEILPEGAVEAPKKPRAARSAAATPAATPESKTAEAPQ